MVFEKGDQHNRPSGLECILNEIYPSDDAFNNQTGFDSFHARYMRQVGKVIGLRHASQNPKTISRPERDMFKKIYEEYFKETRLISGFGSYSRFFNALFVEPYGFSFQDGIYKDTLLPGSQEEQAAISGDDKKDIQNFIRRINLPALLYECLLHDDKSSRHPSKKPIAASISYSRQRITKGYDVTANLARTVWDILLSETGDCTSIKIAKGASGGGEPIAKIGKYWFASLLHHLHPNIHYLVIKAGGSDLPSPLFRVKIMDGVDEQGEDCMIVGGVLGESFGRFKDSDIGTVIEDILIGFFHREGRKGRIFYNLSHGDKNEETCNQFTDYLQHTSRFKYSPLEVIEVIVDKRDESKKHECTHKLRVPGVIKGLREVSVFSKEGKEQLYSGEQYSETFYPNIAPGMPGAFTSLDGFVKGLVLSPPPPKTEIVQQQPKKMSLAKKLAIGGLAVFGAIAGYFMLRGAGNSQDGSEVTVGSDTGVASMSTHNDWRVGPYIDRFGQPAFGPHSDDPIFGNTQNKGPYVDGGGPWSEVSKDDSHTSPSHIDAGVDGFGDDDVSDITEIDSPPTPLCSEVPPEPGWPTGTRIAKRLDFDGDGKSDIVLWREGEFKLDLSRLDGFGVWDMVAKYNDLPGKNFWPFVEDMDSDGLEDFVLYVPDTGTWYVKFTRFPLKNNISIDSWDLIIPDGVGPACKTHLDADPKKSVYGRPLPGDYNGDGMVDLAVVCSDGFWRIDYGGSGCGAFGAIDEQVRFLDETRLAQAPGWAYLPVFDEVPGGRRVMAYKVPDTLPDAGRLVIVRADGTDWSGVMPTLLGGNDTIIVPGRHAGPSSDMVSLMTPEGWKMLASDGRLIPVAGRDTFANCAPVLGDFDGDNVDDAAAYCGDDFRIIKSGGSNDPDGVTNIRLRTFREGEESEYSLPGVVYFGGASYQFVQQLMAQDRQTHPGEPTPIPVDMMRASVSVSSIVFEEDDNGTPFDFFIKQYGGDS